MAPLSSAMKVVDVPLIPLTSKAPSGGVFTSPGQVEYLTV